MKLKKKLTTVLGYQSFSKTLFRRRRKFVFLLYYYRNFSFCHPHIEEKPKSALNPQFPRCCNPLFSLHRSSSFWTSSQSEYFHLYRSRLMKNRSRITARTKKSCRNCLLSLLNYLGNQTHFLSNYMFDFSHQDFSQKRSNSKRRFDSRATILIIEIKQWYCKNSRKWPLITIFLDFQILFSHFALDSISLIKVSVKRVTFVAGEWKKSSLLILFSSEPLVSKYF